MEYKNSGISLAVAFITSMLVLIIALYTLGSITRSFERTVGIERSNKVFFAAESGVEAALFHKNSRGNSVHFDWEPSDTALEAGVAPCFAGGAARCEDIVRSMRLNHLDTDVETRWKVLSRFIAPAGTTGTYSGEIGEFQSIEIPLTYDSAESIIDAVSMSNMTTSNVTVNFQKDIPQKPQVSGGTTDVPFNFGDPTPNTSIIAPPTDTTDTQRRERVIIDWSILRNNANVGVQNFLVNNQLESPCHDDLNNRSNHVICEGDLQDGGSGPNAVTQLVFNGTGSSSLISNGICQPCLTGSCTPTLGQFMDTARDFCNGGVLSDNDEYKLRLQALTPFSHVDETTGEELARISGIPYEIVIPAGAQLPIPQYTIVSNVTDGDYQKEVSFTVNESTSIGAFSYVIFQ